MNIFKKIDNWLERVGALPPMLDESFRRPIAPLSAEGIRTEGMVELVERLRALWLSLRVRIRPGASIDAVEAFETRYGVRLPQDLVDYFRLIDGMEDTDHDEWAARFHAIHALKCLPEALAERGETLDDLEIAPLLRDPQRYFVLVDVLICDRLIAVKLGPDRRASDSPIVWIHDDRFGLMAHSFSQFLADYLKNQAILVLE